MTRLKRWIQRPFKKTIYEKVRDVYNIRGSGVVYDVTNTYLYGRKCSLAKFGKDKEKRKGYRLIQVGLGVTQKEGIPVFHKVFNGNIHDSRTLLIPLREFKAYGIKNGLVIFGSGSQLQGESEGNFQFRLESYMWVAAGCQFKNQFKKSKRQREFSRI